MDFDELLIRYFGTDDLSTLEPERVVAGTEQLRLQFALEKDRDRRFALWSLMYMLGLSPDLDDAFKDADDRDAARDFMEMIDAEMAEDDDD